MTTRNRIQYLLIKHLLEEGEIDLVLPDGLRLAIGITQEDKNGERVIADNYCWVVASNSNREASLDSYNLGLKFSEDKSIIMLDAGKDDKGRPVKVLNIA